ncbi:hypothetical protein MUK42_29021, partial [Musa troglodytarum]
GINLIYFQRISIKQTSICRDDVSKLDANDISGNKDGSFLFFPPTIPKHLKFFHISSKIIQKDSFSFSLFRIQSVTLALGARRAMSAAAALPALFSSMKLIVELITSKVMIPMKSCQSGGFPCSRTPPLASAMAITAAASMTQDRGFHMNPKNFKTLLSCDHPKPHLRFQGKRRRTEGSGSAQHRC